jgi:8-oxo-dGTP pyrophosphatase MutT (NUDIX family)
MTAEVFIVRKDKVLLKRHRKYGSIWLSVGGHIEQGEDPADTALREVKEEVGLDVMLFDKYQQFHTVEENYRDILPPIAIGRHRVNESLEHIVLVYFATSDSDAVVPEESTDEWVWATKDELNTMDLLPNIRAYALAALETLSLK